MPWKRLQKAIIDVIASPQLEETKSVLANTKKQRKLVQAKTGEVLTTPAILKWLQEEAEARKANKKAKVSR